MKKGTVVTGLEGVEFSSEVELHIICPQCGHLNKCSRIAGHGNAHIIAVDGESHEIDCSKCDWKTQIGLAHADVVVRKFDSNGNEIGEVGDD